MKTNNEQLLQKELRLIQRDPNLAPIHWQPERSEHGSEEARGLLPALIFVYNDAVRSGKRRTADTLLAGINLLANMSYAPKGILRTTAMLGMLVLPTVSFNKSCSEPLVSTGITIEGEVVEPTAVPTMEPTIPAFAAPAPATGVPALPTPETQTPVQEEVVEVETPTLEDWLENYAREQATPTPEGTETPEVTTETRTFAPDSYITELKENGVSTVIVVATPSADAEANEPELTAYTLKSAVQYAQDNNITPTPTALSIVSNPDQGTDAIYVYAVDESGTIILEASPDTFLWRSAEELRKQAEIEEFNIFVEGILSKSEEIPMFGETGGEYPISFHMIQSPVKNYATEGFLLNEQISEQQVRQHYLNILAGDSSTEHKTVIQNQLDDLDANGLEQHVKNIITTTLFNRFQQSIAESGIYAVQYDPSASSPTSMPMERIPAGEIELKSLEVILNFSGAPQFTNMLTSANSKTSAIAERHTGRVVIEISFTPDLLNMIVDSESPILGLIVPIILNTILANPDNTQLVSEAGGVYGHNRELDPDWEKLNEIIRSLTPQVIDGVEYDVATPFAVLALSLQ